MAIIPIILVSELQGVLTDNTNKIEQFSRPYKSVHFFIKLRKSVEVIYTKSVVPGVISAQSFAEMNELKHDCLILNCQIS